jgi:type I restriction enzyme S subunit
LIPANSLLLSSRAPIGHIAITTFNCCTNQGFQSLIPNSELVNIDYLYHVIKLSVPRLKDMGRGATFKELSKTMVKGFEIPLPQICLQQDFSKWMTALTVQQDSLLKTLDAASDNFNALLQKAFKGELT